MWVYTTTAIHNYLFRFTVLPLHANSPSSSRFRWRQKCCLWFLRCLHFWAPCLELFWLSRLFKLCFRLHFNSWKFKKSIWKIKRSLSSHYMSSNQNRWQGSEQIDTLFLNGVYSFREQNNPHPPLSPPFKVGVFVVFYK